MPCCSASNCSNRDDRGYRLFKFPSDRDKERQLAWLKIARRKNWTPTRSSRLCEEHFDESQFESYREDGWRKLKPNAVPTIVDPKAIEDTPPSPVDPMSDSPVPFLSDSRRSGGTVCSVVGCNSNSYRAETDEGTILFFSFPIDPKICDQWKKRCNRVDDFSTEYKHICSRHFKPSDYEDVSKAKKLGVQPKILNKKAIPSLFLKPTRPEQSKKVTKVGRRPGPKSKCHQEEEQVIQNKSIDEADSQENPDEPILQGHADEYDRKDAALSITDLSARITNELCRLCLEEVPDMIQFLSVITFADGSTLDILEAFQYLTGETIEQISNPQLPASICNPCLDLLVNAYTFRQKYDRSSLLLKEFMSKISDDKKVRPLYVDPSRIKSEILDENDANETENCIEKPNRSNDGSEDDNREWDNVEMDDNTSNLEQSALYELGRASSLRKNEKGQLLHKCPICYKEFTALELKSHCRGHQALKKYIEVAPKFNTKIRYYATQRNNVCLFYRDSVMHTCPFCSREFNTEQFKIHSLQHREDKNFRCNVCDRIFLGRNHLKQHQLAHQREAPYLCNQCGKSFFREVTYKYHLLGHENKKPFVCEYCGKAFANPEVLRRHNYIHERGHSYEDYTRISSKHVKCKKCLQKFKSVEDRDEHVCRFDCAKCNKVFPNRGKYVAHACKFKKPSQKKEYISSQKKKYNYRVLCYMCGKTVNNLKLHMQTHLPHKKKCRQNYVCAECDAKFGNLKDLARHIKNDHTDEKVFTCNICERTFTSQGNLTVHERTHVAVDKNIHECNICNKKYLQRSYLENHMKIHIRHEKEDEKEESDESNLEFIIDT